MLSLCKKTVGQIDRMKHFIITIDTEGDNLWSSGINDTVTTKNARYLPRFQALCNKYNFKPVYLTNYEMANDDYFVEFACDVLKKEQAEIGLHIHAWNNPPYYELPAGNADNCGLPYLIEYPQDIMREKIKVMTALLQEKFNTEIVSHRAGRWTMNQTYFDMLIENGIKVDCSATPHISWKNAAGYTENSGGSDYSEFPEEPFVVPHSRLGASLIEAPVTIRKKRRFIFGNSDSVLRRCAAALKNMCIPKALWLRPDGKNISSLLSLIKTVNISSSEYLMFMLHSSELMPSGSPIFNTNESIEILYEHLGIIFEHTAKSYTGITLKDYHRLGIETGIKQHRAVNIVRCV